MWKNNLPLLTKTAIDQNIFTLVLIILLFFNSQENMYLNFYVFLFFTYTGSVQKTVEHFELCGNGAKATKGMTNDTLPSNQILLDCHLLYFPCYCFHSVRFAGATMQREITTFEANLRR